jgi:hypothetical protein
VGTVNIGSRALACPSFYYYAVREGVHCHTRQAPPIRTRIGLISNSEITFLTLVNLPFHGGVHFSLVPVSLPGNDSISRNCII